MDTRMQFKALSILRSFLRQELKALGTSRWNELVVPFLTWRNRARARAIGWQYVDQMSLAEVLQVLLKNWWKIADRHCLEPRYFSLIAHLRASLDAYMYASGDWKPLWEEYDRTALQLIGDMITDLQSTPPADLRIVTHETTPNRKVNCHSELPRTRVVKSYRRAQVHSTTGS